MINKKQTKKAMTIEDLARKVDIRIEDLAVKMDTRIDDLAVRIDTKIDASMGNLAIKIQEGFMATAKQEDLLALTDRVTALEKDVKGMHGNFDMVFQQLKEIRDEMKEADTRTDVVDLQLRVAKLEKKVRP